jgi:hypothetical protein
MVNKLQIERGMPVHGGVKVGHTIEKPVQERNLEDYGDLSIRNSYMDYYRQLDPDNIHHCNI